MSAFWRILVYIKRLCKTPAFVIALLLMPVTAYGIRSFTVMNVQSITVGLYASGETGRAVCEDLLSKDYVVKFADYDSLDRLKQDVEFKTIECGYIFGDEFEQGFAKKDLTDSIGCVTSNSSVLHKMINEVIFASVINKMAPDIANDYLKEKNIPITADENYQRYMDSDKLFDVDITYVDSPQIAAKKIFSVSNAVALYSMLGVVLLSASAVRDRKRNIRINSYFGIFAGCLLFTAFSLVASRVGGELTMNTALRYFVYMFVLSGFAYLISVLPREEIIFGLLPVLAVTAAVLSPVFVNVSSFLEILKPLQYIYPVTYFAQSSTEVLVAAAVIVNIIAFAVNGLVHRRCR